MTSSAAPPLNAAQTKLQRSSGRRKRRCMFLGDTPSIYHRRVALANWSAPNDGREMRGAGNYTRPLPVFLPMSWVETGSFHEFVSAVVSTGVATLPHFFCPEQGPPVPRGGWFSRGCDGRFFGTEKQQNVSHRSNRRWSARRCDWWKLLHHMGVFPR